MTAHIDGALESIGGNRRHTGKAVDFYASATLYATWPELTELEPGDDRHEPDTIEITLCFDGTWKAKFSNRL